MPILHGSARSQSAFEGGPEDPPARGSVLARATLGTSPGRARSMSASIRSTAIRPTVSRRRRPDLIPAEVVRDQLIDIGQVPAWCYVETARAGHRHF